MTMSYCTTCEMSAPRDQMLREAPRYMAALDATPDGPVPSEPADECWGCRRIRQAGGDPRALAVADHEAFAAARESERAVMSDRIAAAAIAWRWHGDDVEREAALLGLRMVGVETFRIDRGPEIVHLDDETITAACDALLESYPAARAAVAAAAA